MNLNKKIATGISTLILVALNLNGDELSKKLNNPVASLISVPIENTIDYDVGQEDGRKYTSTFQPVIPFELNEDWNIITRTLIPLIDQDNVSNDDAEGLGDITPSFFFSPKAPTDNGWIWGAGPILLLDTASEDSLGAGQWGAGPTAVALKQTNGWTFGLLSSHVWNVGRDDDRARVNNSYSQPFISYVLPGTKTTLNLNTEYNYDWNERESTGVQKLEVAQMFKIGNQIMQARIGGRYWSDTSPTSPEGAGIVFRLTFLFPK